MDLTGNVTSFWIVHRLWWQTTINCNLVVHETTIYFSLICTKNTRSCNFYLKIKFKKNKNNNSEWLYLPQTGGNLWGQLNNHFLPYIFHETWSSRQVSVNAAFVREENLWLPFLHYKIVWLLNFSFIIKSKCDITKNLAFVLPCYFSQHNVIIGINASWSLNKMLSAQHLLQILTMQFSLCLTGSDVTRCLKLKAQCHYSQALLVVISAGSVKTNHLCESKYLILTWWHAWIVKDKM